MGRRVDFDDHLNLAGGAQNLAEHPGHLRDDQPLTQAVHTAR